MYSLELANDFKNTINANKYISKIYLNMYLEPTKNLEAHCIVYLILKFKNMSEVPLPVAYFLEMFK